MYVTVYFEYVWLIIVFSYIDLLEKVGEESSDRDNRYTITLKKHNFIHM